MNGTTAQEDLAYVRAIAEEGRNVPLVGGPMFLIWGTVISVAAFCQFLRDAGAGFPVRSAALWSIALALGWIVSFIVGKQISSSPGSSTAGNRVAAAAWMSCGIFITVFWLSILGALILLPDGGFPFGYLGAAMFPVAFGLYGLAFMVTAVAANLDWMRWVAGISWVISSLMIFTLNSEFNMLIASAGTVAVALVPGLILMRNQPSDTV